MKRNPKRTLTAGFLALAMLASLLPTAAFASEAEEKTAVETLSEEGYRLNEDAATSGTCGDNLTWTLEDGVLTISGTGDMTSYASHAPWYDSRDSITSVIIGDGVTGIGDYAFYDCDSLTDVALPDSLTDIGSFAFYSCSALTGITLPDSLTTIGNSAFYACTRLTSITIPDGVTSIDGFTFSFCERMTSVVIGSGVTSIGMWAFDGCRALTSITLPDGVTDIGHSAFYACTSLTSVTIPDSVTSIDYGAFDWCTALTDVYYSGSEDDWNAISIGSDNDCLTSATIHYNSNDSAATFLFGDVTNDESWYYAAVYWAYDLGITEGYSDGTFRPNNNCTRAEFTTFLYALANAYGLENAGETTSTSFTDVAEGSWYYTYVMWAAENGLVSGYEDGTFRPNNQITRAEAVTMLYGFYKSFVNGGQEPTVSDEDSGFSDLSEDSWFYTYMLWATQNGVVSGYDDGTCRPNTNCTRSVMVVLLYATANHLL